LTQNKEKIKIKLVDYQQHHRPLLNNKSNSGNDIADFYSLILSQKHEKFNMGNMKISQRSQSYWQNRAAARFEN
jgi:hypothetical protein